MLKLLTNPVVALYKKNPKYHDAFTAHTKVLQVMSLQFFWDALANRSKVDSESIF